MDNLTTVLIADNTEEFCTSLTAALHLADDLSVGIINQSLHYLAVMDHPHRLLSVRRPAADATDRLCLS